MEVSSSLSQALAEQTDSRLRNLETRIAAVRALRTSTASEVCKLFKVNRRTLFRWKARWGQTHNLQPIKRAGPYFKLTDEQRKYLLNQFELNPGLTNEQAATLLDNTIKPRTVSDYLKRASFSRKLFTDEQETYAAETSIQLVKQYCLLIKNIPSSRRVYVDESFIYDNEAPRRGRGLRGQPIPRVRSRHGKRWTVYLAIREDGLIHPPIIDSEPANDLNFYHYVWRTLVPNLRQNEAIIWDRLGKAGRCANPSKQHFNPGVKRLIEQKGCQVIFLPPKGKLFNPIELVFGTLKTHLRNKYTISAACVEQRPRTENELQEDIRNAADK
jgi:transposase